MVNVTTFYSIWFILIHFGKIWFNLSNINMTILILMVNVTTYSKIFLIVEKSNLNLDPFWTDLIQSAPKWSGHFYTHVAISTYIRGCQIGMQGHQICAKPCHFCKLDVATSRMAFLDLNLHVLQLATSNSNNWECSVVQNCTSDTP